MFVLGSFIKIHFGYGKVIGLKICIVMLTGAAGAVLSEKRHLKIGSWAYDESMPIVPFVNVGLLPVLQFFLLPVSIYFLSFYIISKVYNYIIINQINHH